MTKHLLYTTDCLFESGRIVLRRQKITHTVCLKVNSFYFLLPFSMAVHILCVDSYTFTVDDLEVKYAGASLCLMHAIEPQPLLTRFNEISSQRGSFGYMVDGFYMILLQLWRYYEQFQALKGNRLTRTDSHDESERCAHLSCFFIHMDSERFNSALPVMRSNRLTGSSCEIRETFHFSFRFFC